MKLLRKQPLMRRVLIALIPCALGSIYFFGWRCLAVMLVGCAVAVLAEHSFCRKRGQPASEAAFVTGLLYALVMPPTVPWHVLIIGILFAIVFVKELFGGFGCNVFNPAVAGRCFVYVCFPVALTSSWAPAAAGPWGALGQWTTVTEPDAIVTATPMAVAKIGGIAAGTPELLRSLIVGRISGTMGVTSAALILVGGLYLIATRTAKKDLVIAVVITYASLTQILNWAGVAPVPDALTALLGGGFLFGAFFMVTDPVSAPSTRPARIAYAALIGACVVVIRNFSIFNGGLMFSILIGNMFGPIFDHAAKAYSSRRKAATVESVS